RSIALMSTSKRKPLVAVLGGAGAMGRATVFDLTAAGHAVRLLEADTAAAARIARRYGHGRAEAARADARHPRSLATARRGPGAVAHCPPYAFNLAVMEAALRARCHYLDLGGLFHTTRKQLTLDGEFRKRRLLAVLGMGSAPGIMNVLARAAADPLR